MTVGACQTSPRALPACEHGRRRDNDTAPRWRQSTRQEQGQRRTPTIFLSNNPVAIETEYHLRMIVSAAGVPKVCQRKKCRRRKFCLGPFAGNTVPCLAHHNGLVRARYKQALKRLGLSGCVDGQ